MKGKGLSRSVHVRKCVYSDRARLDTPVSRLLSTCSCFHAIPHAFIHTYMLYIHKVMPKHPLFLLNKAHSDIACLGKCIKGENGCYCDCLIKAEIDEMVGHETRRCEIIWWKKARAL